MIGFNGALFLVFLTLKLAGIIAWSWLWVTAPIWIPFGIFLAIVMVGLMAGLVVAVAKGVLGSR